jgi:hypothetical protein
VSSPNAGAGCTATNPSDQQLRKALQSYSSSNDVALLVTTVREIYQNQGVTASIEVPEKKVGNGITRESLRLVCYEYVYA